MPTIRLSRPLTQKPPLASASRSRPAGECPQHVYLGTYTYHRAYLTGLRVGASSGSNRNGFIFSHYSDVQNQVRDVQAQLRARPRSAMDRGFQSNILQFNARAEHIPPSRFRAPSSKPPVKAPANAVRRRLGRPASAPVRYMDPIKVVDRPAVPPRSFRPFKVRLELP